MSPAEDRCLVKVCEETRSTFTASAKYLLYANPAAQEGALLPATNLTMRLELALNPESPLKLALGKVYELTIREVPDPPDA